MSLFNLINQSIINGRFSVGIAGATEPGLPVNRHIRIPTSMIKNFTYTDHNNVVQTVTAANIIADFFQVADPDIGGRRPKRGNAVYTNRRVPGRALDADRTDAEISDARLNPVYTYRGNVITNPSQPDFTQRDIEAFYDLNAPLYNDAGQGWAAEYLPVWLCARLATVVSNLLSPQGDAEIVLSEVPLGYAPSAAATTFALTAASYYDAGKLIIAGGITNWYLLNHTTGQGQLATAARKVTQILGYPFPSGGGTANITARKRAVEWYYDAAHSADKRNGIHAVIEYSGNICAAQIPGLAIGILMEPDDFVRIRAYNRPIPAGHHKQSDTDIAAKMCAKAGLLAFAPGFEEYANLRADLAQITNLMGVSHQGADYLLRDDPDNARRSGVSQNDVKYMNIYDAMGIYVGSVMPNSTIADAPLFRGAVENKGGSHASWLALCTAYAQTAAATSDPALVESIKVQSGAIMGGGLIQNLQAAAAAIPVTDMAGIEHARKVIAQVASRIGKHYAGLEGWAITTQVVGGNTAFTAAANNIINNFQA